MIKNLVEQLRDGVQETIKQVGLLPHKRQYREFLRERLYQMYAARQDEDKFLARLADPEASFTIKHVDQAVRIGKILSLFGLTCRLFDDQLYLKVLNDHPEIFANFDQANAFVNNLIVETKAGQVKLTAADIRLMAVVGYHRESEYWAAGGICPPADSPFTTKK